jgi:hypothetical protein
MSSSIDTFRGYLNRFSDIAKSDRYTVMISVPSMQAAYPQAMEGLSFQCETAEIPGRTLATFEARTYGPLYRYPYESSYSDLNLTFMCMANKAGQAQSGLWEKSFFDDWLDLINPSPQVAQQAAWNMEYRSKYDATITLTHYDSLDQPTYAVKFFSAYPLATTPIQLNWSDDSHAKLSISFTYTWWQRTTALTNQQSNNTISI